jgi:peptide/nickel transport system ATP-binding protein
MSAEPLLRIRNLSVDYGGAGDAELRALAHVDLELGQREVLGIVGESGCGKSTLGMAIVRLLPGNASIAGGEIALAGRDLLRISSGEMRAVRGRDVAVIFQDPATSLNPTLSIGAQLMQVQRAHAAPDGRGRAALEKRALTKLDEVGIPDAHQALARHPHEFSGGMRQRVMIAMALLLEPRLIIADEATSALDVTLEAQILELLLRLRDDHGTAMLFISHDLGVVSQVCDRVVVMYAGRVVEEIGGDDALRSPRHPYTQALQAAVADPRRRGQRLASIPGQVPRIVGNHCAFADRCRYTFDPCLAAEPHLYPTAEGAARCYLYDPNPATGTDTPTPHADDWRSQTSPVAAVASSTRGAAAGDGPILDVRGLRVEFGRRRRLLGRSSRKAVAAVAGVDLTLRSGQILGVVGESGSGKTTLGEALVNLVTPTAGAVLVDGVDIAVMGQRARTQLRRRVQMIFQSPYASLSPRMRIGAAVTEPYEIHDTDKADRRSADALLAMVGLPQAISTRYPNEVSGGQARRVGIARALALEPDLVVADEPTSGLDPSAAAGIVNLLTDLRMRLGITIVLISHSLPLVMTVADEICVMYFGHIVESGPATAIAAAPAHPYTRALLAVAPAAEIEGRQTRRRLLVPGEIPSPTSPPKGCPFHPRCAYAEAVCREVPPPIVRLDESRTAACHFAQRVHQDALHGVTPSRAADTPSQPAGL